MIKQRTQMKYIQKAKMPSSSNNQPIPQLNNHHNSPAEDLVKPPIIYRHQDHLQQRKSLASKYAKEVGEGKEMRTPQDYKTEKNYKQKDEECRDTHIFQPEHNEYQTIKKDKDMQRHGKGKIHSNKGQSKRTQQFQLKNEKSKQSLAQNLFASNEDYQKEQQREGNGRIELSSGWFYKGQYTQNVFHGYGQLFFREQLIYSGHFQFGYFHGHGKMYNCQQFDFLISTRRIESILKARQGQFRKETSILEEKIQCDHRCRWKAYFGEFKKGKVDGFGQVWLDNHIKLMALWKAGRPDMYKFLISPTK